MPNSPVVYSYKPPKWLGFFSFIMFSLFAALFVWIALDNDRGLNVSFYRLPVVSFEDFGATLLYWGFAALFVALSFVSVVLIYNSFASKAELTLTEKDISIPVIKFHTYKTVTIPFNQILSMELQSFNGSYMLYIHHRMGKTRITSLLLPKKKVMKEIVEHLEQKLGS